jgi:stearoyl-CoA desaturase (delta-9 desaturase)
MTSTATATSTDTLSVVPHDERIKWVTSLPFFGVHAMALFAFVVPFKWQYLATCVGLYYFRMWALTTGYHRYFSHRTFKTGRVFQFILAFCACLCTQKGPLWWAAHHRHHHRFSDQEEDVHSPLQRGFWWSHMGWILCDRYTGTRYDSIKDFAKYPELRWLNRWYLVPPVALAVALFFIGGFPLLVWGFFVSTTLLWHGTFTINSLSHVFGRRRYKTSDTSRNNWLLALITCGEGWHNNHHYHQNTANQGWFWWEFDPSFYVLRLLAVLGIVSDVRTPPEAVKLAYLRYTQEERTELRGTPALFGSSRRAVVQAARRAVQRASELQLSAPSTAPVLRR